MLTEKQKRELIYSALCAFIAVSALLGFIAGVVGIFKWGL